MTTINYIHLRFNLHSDTEISIDTFRSEILNYVGNQFTDFHNHNKGNFLYRYPLIQFKRINNFYYLVGINNGADIILSILEKKDFVLLSDHFEIKDKPYLKLETKRLSVVNTLIPYKIYNWFALNSENYEKYNSIISLSEKVQLLENILKANILSFAKGIDWTIEKHIQLCIHSIDKVYFNKFKGIDVINFDAIFYTNVILPDLIGLGKSSSKGFGIIKKIPHHQMSKKN